jgi:hypothetical protein
LNLCARSSGVVAAVVARLMPAKRALARFPYSR